MRLLDAERQKEGLAERGGMGEAKVLRGCDVRDRVVVRGTVKGWCGLIRGDQGGSSVASGGWEWLPHKFGTSCNLV